ncbi:MAG: dihydrolipoyl dehydrogenase [Candidatus Riflebacteria bacterium]|nr:dihydrolipoyl dehydrogenase [Candidatus Riflebacteria bacterium]
MVVGSFAQGCQVAVIGAGPGGYVAAIRLAQLGRDVILIEEAPELGGVCLTEGCIPSKALIHAANLVEATRHCGEMGVVVTGVTLDMPRLVAWKDRIVARLTDGVRGLCSKNGVQVVRGRARLTGQRKLRVRGADGDRVVEFEQVVIATGSLPLFPEELKPDGSFVVGSREAVSVAKVPGQLVVVGGGYIGLELGAVFAKLGSRVRLLEALPVLLPRADPEVVAVLTRRMTSLGMELHLGCRALGVERGAPGKVHVQDARGERLTLEADLVLVASGRMPNVSDLGLESTGVALDDRGFVKVNARMETSVPGVYAIGDVVGGPLLAHKAYREAKVAAQVIARKPSAFDNVVVPAVIYTDPEIAWAGLTEAEAREQGHQVVTGRFPFGASGRALTLDAPEGFVKTVADASTQRILGVQIVGAEASELIAEAALAIEMGAFLDDLAQTIHPHPTLSEGLLESVDAALGEAIHIANR